MGCATSLPSLGRNRRGSGGSRQSSQQSLSGNGGNAAAAAAVTATHQRANCSSNHNHNADDATSSGVAGGSQQVLRQQTPINSTSSQHLIKCCSSSSNNIVVVVDPTSAADNSSPPPTTTTTTTEVVKKRRQVAATTTTTDGSTSSIDSTLQHQPHPESGDNNVGTTVQQSFNDQQVNFGSMRAPLEPLKLMLAVEREDSQSDAWLWAWRKLTSTGGGGGGSDNKSSSSQQQILVRSLQPDVVQRKMVQLRPNVIVIDRRRQSSSSDPDALCRWIRSQPGGHYPVIVAIVKRTAIEREDSSVASLLQTGYDRCYPESGGNLGSCYNELLMLQMGELQWRQRLRLAEAALAVASVTRELVTVTDGHFVIRYINSGVERLLGFSAEDVVGRNMMDVYRGNGGAGGSGNSETGSGRFDLADAVQQVLQQRQQQQQQQQQQPTTTSGDNSTTTTTSREWEGTCSVRRKTGDSVPLYSRLIAVHSGPSACPGGEGVPDYVLLLQEPPPLFIDKSFSSDIMTTSDLYPMPRNSLHSGRKASYDVRSLGSDGAVIRRQSLARLHSMAIEGPITKVINIISAAQESSPNYISQALDKVLDILRSNELFAPHVTEMRGRNDDPVTNDLVGALLLGQKPAGYIRRSSNESSSVKSATGTVNFPSSLISVSSQLQQQGQGGGGGGGGGGSQMYSRPLLPTLNNITIPIQLREMLENDSQWDFDVVRLEKLTSKRPLVWLGMTIMTRFEVPRTLNCDEATLQNWLTVIEANYHATNTYHNSTHAADVLQATAFFLQRNRIKALLDPLDQTACLIAAAIHDVDHPGKTSGFLCNSGSELAILYNDLSVLESHHAALAFKLTCHDDRVNIFKGLDRESYKVVRQSVIDMVLATEMTKHFEHLTKFINIFAKPFLKDEDQSEPPEIDYAGLNTSENVILVKRMLIKCADVSNPTRPLNLCIEWARRIAEEYFNQTAEEKAKGLPVVMPQFDRQTCSIPKSQIGFTDYFISDMFDAWDAFAEVPELLQHMKRNYQFWKEQEAMGVTGLPAEFSIPQTPTDLARKIEFDTLAESNE